MSTTRTRRRALLGTAVAAVIALGAAAPAAAAEPAETADPVQESLDALVGKELPGAWASVLDADGESRDYVAGVGDRKTGAEPPVNGYGRIGSATKTYVATVVLQLVGEGKVDLDAPIEDYLPKLVRGKGIDGRKITVRQLLQHTSGLPNYTGFITDYFEIRHTYMDPRQVLDLALSHKASFAPGTKWEYSNTNYILLGLLVQKVTGRPIGEQVTDRIIKPLGLKDTYWPGIGEQGIRSPHPEGYAYRKPGAPLVEFTEMDPSWGWAAGQMIATPSDVNRFYRALLDGKLLKPAQLAEMRRTVKDESIPFGWQFGLGLVKIKLSCGGHAWGHGGDIDGYETRDAATDDGRAATVMVNALPSTEAGAVKVNQALDTALCRS